MDVSVGLSGEMVDSVYNMVGFGFFFQAEDGIRDLVRSRGLGDVYKRQLHHHTGHYHPHHDRGLRRIRLRLAGVPRPWPPVPVSYTHLTLPTIYSA